MRQQQNMFYDEKLLALRNTILIAITSWYSAAPAGCKLKVWNM